MISESSFTPVLFLLGHVFFLLVFPATTPAPSNLITPSVYVAYQSLFTAVCLLVFMHRTN